MPNSKPGESAGPFEDTFKDRVILQALVAESDKLRDSALPADDEELLLSTPLDARVIERDVGAWENRAEFCVYKESVVAAINSGSSSFSSSSSSSSTSSSLSSSSSPRDMPPPPPRPPPPAAATASRSVGVVYLAQEDKEREKRLQMQQQQQQLHQLHQQQPQHAHHQHQLGLQHQQQSSPALLKSPRRRTSPQEQQPAAPPLPRSESETLRLPHIDVAVGLHARLEPRPPPPAAAPAAAADHSRRLPNGAEKTDATSTSFARRTAVGPALQPRPIGDGPPFAALRHAHAGDDDE